MLSHDPQGSHILLSRLGLWSQPKVWETPLRFYPERHLNDGDDEQVDLREHELRFFSFSTGRRGCIGSIYVFGHISLFPVNPVLKAHWTIHAVLFICKYSSFPIGKVMAEILQLLNDLTHNPIRRY